MIPSEILLRYEAMIGDQGILWAECIPDPGTDLAHLRWMLSELWEMRDTPKAMRWLGFVQGVLIMRGLTTVQTERDFTRPYFTAGKDQ